jgi:hypothetical protein
MLSINKDVLDELRVNINLPYPQTNKYTKVTASKVFMKRELQEALIKSKTYGGVLKSSPDFKWRKDDTGHQLNTFENHHEQDEDMQIVENRRASLND